MNKRTTATGLRCCAMACLACLCLSATGYAQHELRVTACDDGQPLPYATVVVRGEPRYTDREGRITLATTDSAEVRCVGYSTAVVMPGQQTVCLEASSVALGSVVIESKRIRAYRIGYRPKPLSIFRYFDGNGSKFGARLQLIQNTTQKPARVLSARFYFHTYEPSTSSISGSSTFRVMVHSVLETHVKDSLIPGRLLVPEILINPRRKGEHYVDLDLRQYGIVIPPVGLFIGLFSKEQTGGWYNPKTRKTVEISSRSSMNDLDRTKRWGTFLIGSKSDQGVYTFRTFNYRQVEYKTGSRDRHYFFFSLEVMPLE